MIDAHKGWTEGGCTTTGFFDGMDRWRTANPPPGPRVRAAARLQLGHFRRPHQGRWWEALALTMLPAAVVAAALTIVALDDVLMVLLVAIALMLVGIFVYVIYALALATRSRAYPVTRWRHRFRVMWLTNPASTVGAALTVYLRRGGAVLPQPLPMARNHTPAAAGRTPATARTTDHCRRGRPSRHHLHHR
ncbi:hypothetical protein WSS_A05964 [Rhodococcus opacus M213]|uniref:Uncharacterized protein n=1 Tax=Rhodococcus opacus M213 TaxID=1129896 RepID=K8XZ77_RHOOP|nr:hypothetical protein WSS_A05964 [Rhodococcus opacus M213]